MRKRWASSYTPPGRDSDRARAQATLFLTSARSIDHVTADRLAADYRLSVKMATYLLTLEQQRRAGL